MADYHKLNGGQLSLPAGAAASDLVLSEGSLTLGGNLNVTTARAFGGTLNLGDNEIVIADELKMGDANFVISQDDTFSLTGTDVTVDPTLVLSSGTLTISVPTLPTDNLALHLAANAVSGVASGEPVAQWDDLSDRGNDVSQGVVGQQRREGDQPGDGLRAVSRRVAHGRRLDAHGRDHSP